VRRTYLVPLVCISCLACWHDDAPPLPTINGPETLNLLPQIHGVLLTRHRRAMDGLTAEIAAVELPGLQQAIIRPPADARYVEITQVSGPDENGRIAYVQENADGGSARLGTVRLDGTENRVISTASGERHSVFGAYPTLAPRGGNIAVMQRTHEDADSAQPAELQQLTIWNVDTKQRSHTAVGAEDIGVSWFPDGDSLVYVAALREDDILPTTLDDLTGNDPACLQYIHGMKLVPVVSVLDIGSGRIHPLHAGTNPVVSSDGRSVLLRCGGFVVLDAANHTVVPARWAGDSQLHMVWLGHIQTPLAFLGGNVVVYRGLPTTGAPVIFDPLGSVDGGGQLVTIKIAALGTREFQTVIPAIDPRWPVSFGQPRTGLDSVSGKTPFAKYFY
jgi:hypothetical protein